MVICFRFNALAGKSFSVSDVPNYYVIVPYRKDHMVLWCRNPGYFLWVWLWLHAIYLPCSCYKLTSTNLYFLCTTTILFSFPQLVHFAWTPTKLKSMFVSSFSVLCYHVTRQPPEQGAHTCIVVKRFCPSFNVCHIQLIIYKSAPFQNYALVHTRTSRSTTVVLDSYNNISCPEMLFWSSWRVASWGMIACEFLQVLLRV